MLVSLLMLAIVGYVAWVFICAYRETPGSTWDRILAAGKGSATILWSRFVVLVSAAATAAAGAADYLNAPGVSDAIRGAMKPEYVGPAMIGIMLISEWARRRTLEK